MVEIQEGFRAAVIDVEEVFDEELSQNDVKGRFCIKIEDEDWLFQRIQRMLDCFRQKYCSQLVGTTLSLELSLRLITIPSIKTDVSDEEIQCSRHHRTGRNSTIGST